MPEQGLKARVLVNSVPAEVGLTGLLAGALPSLPLVRRGRATTVGAVLASAAQIAHHLVEDQDYQCTADDRQVGMRPLTAPRTIYLPDVDLFPLGEVLFVADYSGLASDALTITIRPGPDTGDLLGVPDGVAQIISPYQGLGFRRGDTNLWIRA